MRAVHITILLLTLAVPACDRGGGGDPAADERAPDFGPTAAYNRRLLFVGPGAQAPTSAVFDFTALSDSIGIRRGVRARVTAGSRWRALMDEGWEMEPMREPWRIVPHGPLTMVVTESGDLGELVHRDSVTTRLRIGPAFAEHSPDVGTQLVLRNARLVVGDTTVSGILLDAQLGRAVSPAMVRREPAVTGRTDTAPDDTATADAGAPATPIARPGAEALLLDGRDYYAVLATASGGSLAWTRSAGQDDVRAGTRLEPTAWTGGDEAGVQVPTAWRVVSPDGAMTGELEALSSDRVVLRGAAPLEALSYALVSGWIEDRSARREVFGLIRHVR